MELFPISESIVSSYIHIPLLGKSEYKGDILKTFGEKLKTKSLSDIPNGIPLVTAFPAVGSIRLISTSK